MRPAPARSARKLKLIMNKFAIVKYVKLGASRDVTLLIEEWAMKCNVEGLPFARFTGGVHQRLGAPIERAALTVRIRCVVIAVEHLNFILAHHKNAAIAASLAVALCDFGCGELNV